MVKNFVLFHRENGLFRHRLVRPAEANLRLEPMLAGVKIMFRGREHSGYMPK